MGHRPVRALAGALPPRRVDAGDGRPGGGGLQAAAREGHEPVWLLVSHGDPIKAVLSHALGQQLDDFQRIVVDPASVSIVHYPANRDGEPAAPPMVLAMNTTAGQLRERLGGAASGPQLGGGLGSQQDA